MRKPNFGKPRSATGMFTLSRRLPKLSLPASAPTPVTAPAHPQVGRPARRTDPAGPPASSAPPATVRESAATVPPAAPGSTSVTPPVGSIVEEAVDGCTRCGHGHGLHPVRYVCDRYPHPDPLQICGCEREVLDDACESCGHKARAHKARSRCRSAGCHCWGYEQVARTR